jgi:hypothetical protein
MTLESQIERAVTRFAETLGFVSYKLHEANAPDRIYVSPKNFAFFVEFKQKGQKPRPGQEAYHEMLRDKGQAVYVVDNTAFGKALIAAMQWEKA